MTRILLAGGGTGGHLRPAVTLADELVASGVASRCLFLIAGREVERRFLADGSHDLVPLFEGWESRPPPWRLDVYRRAWSLARARRREFAPHATVLLGGYVAALGLAGRRRTEPCLLLESNARPGRTARFLARRSTSVLIQWEAAGRRLSACADVRLSGMPLSRELGSLERAAARVKLGLSTERFVLLVLGGSQGALAVNRMIVAALSRLGPEVAAIQVLHIAGPRHESTVRSATEKLGCGVQVSSFVSDMPTAYAAADLVVARAGGMTVAELCAAGRASILVPYPHHRDQHQLLNARQLVEKGAAVVVEESGSAVEELAGHLHRLISDRALRDRMERAAGSLRRSDPLGQAVDLVRSLAAD